MAFCDENLFVKIIPRIVAWYTMVKALKASVMKFYNLILHGMHMVTLLEHSVVENKI